MANETYEMLLKEINSDIEVLNSLGLSDDEYKVCVHNIQTLYKLKLEEDKLKLQLSQDEYKQKLEEDKLKLEEDKLKLQLSQDKYEKKKDKSEALERYAKIGVDILGVALPLIFYAHWLRVGMKFEETGTFTSTTFKGLFNKFRPTK